LSPRDDISARVLTMLAWILSSWWGRSPGRAPCNNTRGVCTGCMRIKRWSRSTITWTRACRCFTGCTRSGSRGTMPWGIRWRKTNRTNHCPVHRGLSAHVYSRGLDRLLMILIAHMRYFRPGRALNSSENRLHPYTLPPSVRYVLSRTRNSAMGMILVLSL